MQVVKGDKVLFQQNKRPGEACEPDGIGIVKCFPRPAVVDLLCQGEGLDYRVSIDMIKEVYGNVFECELTANS